MTNPKHRKNSPRFKRKSVVSNSPSTPSPGLPTQLVLADGATLRGTTYVSSDRLHMSISLTTLSLTRKLQASTLLFGSLSFYEPPSSATCCPSPPLAS